jgi:hypothetical protein
MRRLTIDCIALRKVNMFYCLLLCRDQIFYNLNCPITSRFKSRMMIEKISVRGTCDGKGIQYVNAAMMTDIFHFLETYLMEVHSLTLSWKPVT